MTDSTTSMSKPPEQVDSIGGKIEYGDTLINHEPNELPRQFSLFSTLAFGFSMTNSWLGYSATFITPLLLGGSPTVFFGLIAASIASCFISRSAISGSRLEHPLTSSFLQRPVWLSSRRPTPPAADSIILLIWSPLRSIALLWPSFLDG